MKNNLEFLRTITDLRMSDIAKLLNIRVDKYRQYENGTMIIPDAQLIIIAKLYKLPICFLFCNNKDIDNKTVEYLKNISKIERSIRLPMLIKNLTGDESSKLTYHQIAKMITGIKEALTDLSKYL